MADPQVSKRKWHFDWRLMLFSGFFLPVLIGLGTWQLDRAGQKQSMLESWQQEADTLPWQQLIEGEVRSGKPVRVTGMYGEQSWLLDNRTRDGVPGYEVITDFYPLEGPPVLVNRGWIQAPRSRDRLPRIDTPEGLFTLVGRLGEYPVPPVLAEQDQEEQGWPRRVQRLPREAAANEVDGLPAVIIRLDSGQQPGAFRADWVPDLMGPGTHYGYAAQWFALAVALTILTVAASYRKTGAHNDNDNG
ncbi:MAG: SURF1 family protein [Marinobacter sp.]|uniref:SURF1 family protein n=1 Tax=Marinobacter sp. TaxID=50741 RepID=UPI00396E995E